VLLSFEGPDEYSRAGGLGVRETELGRTLARLGHETHLFFVGDPTLPGDETGVGGSLHLHRWSQWISVYHPGGVYDGEQGKKLDWDASIPDHVADRIVEPALKAGFRVAVIGEDWQTADSIVALEAGLRTRGLRDRVVLAWNANNVYGNWRIDWPALNRAATILTVSRYMKFLLWREGVNAIVVPNGIPKESIRDPGIEEVATLREAAWGEPFLFKIGRFDPDKRWLMAIEAAAILKHEGRRVRLLTRGGREPHGADVLVRARELGMKVAEIRRARSVDELGRAMVAAPQADVLNVVTFLPDELLAPIYHAADAVLANSGHEPFGLVGLEVMAAGGLAVTGSSGEDYAEPFRNALVMETDDPHELAAMLRLIRRDAKLATSLRKNGRATARDFTWDHVVPQLMARLELAAARQEVAGW
jgi:glycosyltransferase involved in cell wall biosynthesis